MDDQTSERPSSSPRLKILVVDDKSDNAEMLSLLFRLDGHDSRTAFSGPETIRTVEVFAPDIVFLDLGLPVMDGYQVAQRLKEMPALKQTMLVALTGHGFLEDKERTRRAGFDHHIVKPADLDELQALLLRVAERKAMNRGFLV